MRGRPGCPTGQKKNSVEATAGRVLFSTRKGWVQDRPLIRPGFAGPPSPQGEGFGGGKDPSRLRSPPFPARPAGGRAVTGVGSWAAGQAEKREDPRRVPQTRKGGSREEEPLPPWCSFLRLSPKKAGLPRRSRRGKPTSQVWTCTGSGHPHRRPPLTPPAAGRRPGHAPPVGSPAPPGRAPRPQWCWGARPG